MKEEPTPEEMVDPDEEQQPPSEEEVQLPEEDNDDLDYFELDWEPQQPHVNQTLLKPIYAGQGVVAQNVEGIDAEIFHASMEMAAEEARTVSLWPPSQGS
jgi:hypothetical protein